MRTYRQSLLILSILLLCIQFSKAQVNIELQYDNFLSHRSGHILAVGLSKNIAKTNLGLGVSYNDLSCFQYDKYVVAEGCTSSNGFGLTMTANRYFTNKKVQSGLFYGLRSDVQFLENISRSALSFPSTEYITSNIVFLAVGQLGYGLSFINDLGVQLVFSTGYSSHPLASRHTLFMASIKISKKLLN